MKRAAKGKIITKEVRKRAKGGYFDRKKGEWKEKCQNGQDFEGCDGSDVLQPFGDDKDWIGEWLGGNMQGRVLPIRYLSIGSRHINSLVCSVLIRNFLMRCSWGSSFFAIGFTGSVFVVVLTSISLLLWSLLLDDDSERLLL